MKKALKSRVNNLPAGTILSIPIEMLTDKSFRLLDNKAELTDKKGYTQLVTTVNIDLENDDLPNIEYQGETYYVYPTI